MSARKSPTITEAEWRSAIEAEFKAARTPPKPPPGAFSFDAWRRQFGLGITAAKARLNAMVDLGILEVITIPAHDALGRVTPRRFWRRKAQNKKGDRK